MALLLQTTTGLIDTKTPQWWSREPGPVMTIPSREGQYNSAPFFERRANGDRCMLFYTFSEDLKNWERFAWCSTDGTAMVFAGPKLASAARRMHDDLDFGFYDVHAVAPQRARRASEWRSSPSAS